MGVFLLEDVATRMLNQKTKDRCFCLCLLLVVIGAAGAGVIAWAIYVAEVVGVVAVPRGG